jgi:O-antigen/teichoic acid export membrane protein
VGVTRLVARNTVLLTVGLLAGRVLALFVTRKMTNILGTDGMGVWGWATDVTVLFLTVTNFGLGTLLTREVARARGMTLDILWAALRLRWLMAAGSFLVLFCYVSLTGKDELARMAMLVSAAGLFVETTAMACDSVLQAHDRIEYQTLGQLVSAVVYFGLAYWALDAGHGLMGVIWANLASRIVRLLVMVPLMLVKTGPWRRGGEDGQAAPALGWMMRIGWPLFLSTTFGQISYKVDIAMLTELKGTTDTGLYLLGHRPLDLMIMLPNLFAMGLFPAMARIGAGGEQDAARMGERALRYMMLAVLPATLLCMLTADPIIRWFDRLGEFPASIPILQVVIWGLPFQAANTILNRLLITAGREHDFVKIATAAMVTNVVLNLILIPRYTYYGAGAATLASMATSCLLHIRYVRQTPLRIPLRRAVGGAVAALAAAWLATAGIGRLAGLGAATPWLPVPVHAGWGPFLVMLGAGAALYAAAIAGLRLVGRDDLRLLRQLGGRD